MTTYSNKKTIKPSLKMFPLTWQWVISMSIVIYMVGINQVTLHLIFIYWLPPVVLMLLATYGRSYVISENVITKINHITGKNECINVNAIRRMQIKPIAFGYGHMILTLAGGHKFKIKNIKLPIKHELDMFN